MNQAQIELAKIIGDEAIATIAKAQGATIEEVTTAIQEGNKVVTDQFKKLIELGIKTVAAL